MNTGRRSAAVVLAALLAFAAPLAARETGRVTILYDAFGAPSAFGGYLGRRILFDTGNDANIFAHYARQLGIASERFATFPRKRRHGRCGLWRAFS